MNLKTNTLPARVALIGLILISIPFAYDVTLSTVPQAPESLPVSLAFSALYLAFFLLLFRFTRIWTPKSWGWIAVALLWGGFAISLWVKAAGASLSTFTKQIGMPMFSSSLAGALPEELGKFLGVFLIALVFTQIKKPWQVFLIGVFVGLGFTIIENIGYAASGSMVHPSSDSAGALNMWLMRSGLGFGAHSIYTAAASWGLAQALFSPHWSTIKKLAVTSGWFLAGFMLHFIWNSSLGDPMIHLAKTGVMIFISYALFLFLFLRARRLAKQEETITAESTR